jgi:ubiquinone/menaquinone biosynthesis C-methylase UbiE
MDNRITNGRQFKCIRKPLTCNKPNNAIEDKLKTLFGSYYYGTDIKSLKLKGNESILDFGCGGGAACLYLLRILNKKGHVLGVDTSAHLINLAKKRMQQFPNAGFKVGDIRKLDIPEHSMDVIVSFNVFHHISPKERPLTIIALSRLLGKHGQLMVRERIEKSHGIPVNEYVFFLQTRDFKR